KRKSRSTGDRFRFSDFTHGQNSAWWMAMRMQFQSGRIDLNQGAKALTPVHAGRAREHRHRRNLLRKQHGGVVEPRAKTTGGNHGRARWQRDFRAVAEAP